MKTPFHKTLNWIWIVILIISPTLLFSQEICDNGIDDDGDGLVDINDELDCSCGDIAFEVINADFEDYTCCPDNVTFLPNNGIYCLDDGWQPASMGTSDYYNTCDFLGGILVPEIPQPIPSGEGAIGMFTSSTYEETVGTCLDNSLIDGESYDLSFYVGFHEAAGLSSPLDMNIVVYGTPNCDDFPVSGVNCLDTYGEWEIITVVPVSGVMDSSWLFVSTTFVSTVNAEAIAFSNECAGAAHYHFLDDITLEGVFANEEEGDEITMSGNCVSGVELETPSIGGASYQWYLEGEAIIGANSSTYTITNADQEGNYQVVVTDASGCTVSEPLEGFIDENVLELNGNISDVNCLGNDDGAIDLIIDSPNLPFNIEWSNGEFDEDISDLESGNYLVTVTDNNGCIGSSSFEVLDPPTVNAIYMGDCNSGVEVSVNQINTGETYQWYYEGVAVVGATTNPYLVPTDAQGDYYVVITNGVNCQSSEPISIFFNTETLSITEELNHVLCYGDETGSIDIEINNDNGPYEYEWSNGWLGQDLENIAAGEYSVTVSDDYGCVGEAVYTIEEPSDFFNFANVTQPSGGSGGEATIVSNGGVQPYTYAWSNGNETNSDTDLLPGVYTVIITDANGCEDIVTFNIEGDFVVIETIQSAGCHNECNGSISLTIDGPPVDYTIQWEDSQYQGFDLIDLCAGEYVYSVIDVNGAEFNGIALVSDFDSIQIEALYIDTLCSTSDSTLIAIEVDGGTAPYNYLWDTNSTNDSIYNATVGLYSLTVTDANLCEDSINVQIGQYDPPTIEGNIIPAGCDGEAIGAIDLMIINGESPITYLWSNGEMTEDLFNLTQGAYEVQIIDGNNCTYIQSFNVGANTGFSVMDTIVNVNCPQENDGTITLDIHNGIEPYNINWSHGPSTEIVNNLAPGQYTVSITDASGCEAIYMYQVNLQSDISVEAIIEDDLCSDQSTGSISLIIDDGGVAYDVLWNDGSNEIFRDNLDAGLYEVTISDEYGCMYDFDYVVQDLSEAITIELEIIPDTCGSGGVGSIDIMPTSGIAPFTYLWGNDFEDNQISNVDAGVYSVSIYDANGCEIVEEVVVNSISDLEVDFNTTPIICAGTSTASATLIPVGGMSPYTYLWEDNSSLPTINNLAGNTSYAYTVTDSNGCVGVGSVIVEDSLQTLELMEIQNNPLCFGDMGSISVLATGGLEPYDYMWSNDSIGASVNVLAGNYDVMITDALGCTTMASYLIDEPEALILSTTSLINPGPTNSDGSIEISINGGSPNYEIIWSNGETSNAIIGLSAGNYSVTVTDMNGCVDSLSYTLIPEIPLSAQYIISNNPCFGDCVGSIELVVTGGVAPYFYQWSDGSQLDSLVQLCNGNYEVFISDSEGTVIQSGVIPISSPDDIFINGIVYDISCLEAQDGAITVDVIGGTSPYQYEWDNSAEGDSIGNLSNGTYEVLAIDNNGCEESAEFTLEDIPLINVDYEILEIECGDQDYTIEVIGDNPYNYPYLLNGQNLALDNNQLSGLSNGSYTLTYLINESCEIVVDEFVLDPITEYQINLAEESVLVKEGDTTILNVVVSNINQLSNYEIDWVADNDFTCIEFSSTGECLSIELVADFPETIIMIFTDQYGCVTELYLDIELLEVIPEVFIPNIFSPNEDGRNDDFTIQSNEELAFLKSLNIFDRWGNLLFKEENVLLSEANTWDGSFNGTRLNPGVYIYVAEVEFDGKVNSFYGDITIIH